MKMIRAPLLALAILVLCAVSGCKATKADFARGCELCTNALTAAQVAEDMLKVDPQTASLAASIHQAAEQFKPARDLICQAAASPEPTDVSGQLRVYLNLARASIELMPEGKQKSSARATIGLLEIGLAAAGVLHAQPT